VALFLGIDGGGSKTVCAVGDERSSLGFASAAGSNIVRLGEAKVRSSLQTAIAQACAAASVAPSAIAQTCIGAAGASLPHISETIRHILSGLVSGEITVVGDMMIAMEAAFGGGPGMVVIAGTGSIAFGRNQHGETARAGGLGWAISDEGSGHWIGRLAVSAAMRALDSGQTTSLMVRIMKRWHLAAHEDLAASANALPQPDFSQLFPEVLAASQEGDRIARDILISAGSELAQLGKIVMRRLWPGEEAVAVAMAGGVFGHSETVRQAFCNSIHAERSMAALEPEIVNPVAGALSLARKAAGVYATPASTRQK